MQYIIPLHLTPASSEWSQLCAPMGFVLHSSSDDSFPLHNTLSRKMEPEPLPKKAPCTATDAPKIGSMSMS